MPRVEQELLTLQEWQALQERAGKRRQEKDRANLEYERERRQAESRQAMPQLGT